MPATGLQSLGLYLDADDLSRSFAVELLIRPSRKSSLNGLIPPVQGTSRDGLIFGYQPSPRMQGYETINLPPDQSIFLHEFGVQVSSEELISLRKLANSGSLYLRPVSA